MARYTVIYSSFLERIKEVELLRAKAKELECSEDALSRGKEINALCRGSVVLLSAHIEAYIKELGEHTLDMIFKKAVCRSKLSHQFFYYISKQNIEAIRSTAQPASISEQMFKFLSKEVQFWEQKDPFKTPIPSEIFNAGFANPTPEKIGSYLGRFGYSNFRTDVAHILKNETDKTLRNLNLIVETRNLIAHGDLNASKTPAEIADMISGAKTFCRTSDQVFSKWCSDNLCSIR